MFSKRVSEKMALSELPFTDSLAAKDEHSIDGVACFEAISFR